MSVLLQIPFFENLNYFNLLYPNKRTVSLRLLIFSIITRTNKLINEMFQFKTNYVEKNVCMHAYHPPTHTRDLQRELTLHRNQYEINTFYVALKAVIDLWIHLLCLRKVSLAFFPPTRVTRKRIPSQQRHFSDLWNTMSKKNTRQCPAAAEMR